MELPPSPLKRDSAKAMQDEWRIYRKFMEEDYASHSHAYDLLLKFLSQTPPKYFTFLDIACGDASASGQVLAQTAIGSYFGIDISAALLYFANRSLRVLKCPVHLLQGDLIDVVGAWDIPIDVAWIGLSLHHFERDRKLSILTSIRRILAPKRGSLLIYENASRDGEGRMEWLDRWDSQRSVWTAFDDAEWQTLSNHVHKRDFPECHRTWLDLGLKAGFASSRLMFISPTDLFRMYRFDS